MSNSESPSTSMSPQPSMSTSMSPSASMSNSASASTSMSPSMSTSMSPSNSPSVTTSLSTSMLPSVSQSASPSVSNADEPSLSQSIAPSSTQQTSPAVSSSVGPGDGMTLMLLSRGEWVGYSLTFTLRVCRKVFQPNRDEFATLFQIKYKGPKSWAYPGSYRITVVHIRTSIYFFYSLNFKICNSDFIAEIRVVRFQNQQLEFLPQKSELCAFQKLATRIFT